ncbi:MAG: UDP-N-acetylglucosamine 2-epimerase (hydrolyzing) [Calditrichaeota bacterium]|nr:UDP-N-acetylglucosamine 2-epimerase (hydrolyzing) [Calditrichota bacterium]
MDYSAYLPLMKKIREDGQFSLEILACGTHLSNFHGYTVELIKKDGFVVAYEVESLILGDSPEAISSAMGLTMIKFSQIWQQENYDLIICLGDRYEMFAAVASSVPFNIPIAHLHGGETTLGAIDDKFRHCITQMSQYHFTSTAGHAQKVTSLIGTREGVHNVGAIGLDNLNDLTLLNKPQFFDRYGIDLNQPTILSTFHPETVSADLNIHFVQEMILAMENLDYQIVITMPNADTRGNRIRDILNTFISQNSRVFGIESFGPVGYYSCMKYCAFLLGNTSSGIIEAASFGKYTINLGDRQKGREHGDNVIHCPVLSSEILKAVQRVENAPQLEGRNIYGTGDTADKIMAVLRKMNDKP